MSKQLAVVGINHRTSGVEDREKFYLSPGLARKFLRSTWALHLFREALVLSTCNRTEIYFVTHRGKYTVEEVLVPIGRLKGVDRPLDTSLFYHYRNMEAVTHLFEVAASLDSQVVGEDEILSKMKDAYRLAHRAGTTGALLNKLLHRAFRVGKRVRSETLLNTGATSIPEAAVDLCADCFRALKDKRVLLIGAGDMARSMARALMRREVTALTVANRTLSRAQELADYIASAHRPEGEETSAACHQELGLPPHRTARNRRRGS